MDLRRASGKRLYHARFYYVIYITSYGTRKIFRPAMLKGPQDLCAAGFMFDVTPPWSCLFRKAGSSLFCSRIYMERKSFRTMIRKSCSSFKHSRFMCCYDGANQGKWSTQEFKRLRTEMNARKGEGMVGSTKRQSMSGLPKSSCWEDAFTSGSALTISEYLAQRPVITFTTLIVILAPPVIAKVNVLEQGTPPLDRRRIAYIH